ncbi:MAG: sugar transferase [Candidatus Andersenbacteria bacterium]|nr:sugar transferase [Candidatus Andersenbacteria bacterium]
MKRSELLFGAILVPIDFIALLGAGAAAYYLRVSSYVQRVRPATFQLDLPLFEYLQLAAIIALVVVVIFSLQGLYAMQATRRLRDELTRIFAGISMGVMGVIIYVFLSAELFHSRFILLAAYFFALIFVSLGRWLLRRLQLIVAGRGIGVYRVMLVGNGRYARQLAEIFSTQPQLGYRVAGMLDIVRWDRLEDMYRRSGIDEVMQTDPSLPAEDNLVLLDFCDKYKLGYRYVPDLFETYAARVHLRQIGGVPLMELMRTPLEGWGRIAKRVMDLGGAVVGLAGLSPLFAVIAVLSELDSPGPVFYRQTRVGRNRELFEMYKFRTMRSEYCTGERYGGAAAQAFEYRLRAGMNERSGPLFKMKRDPRVTRVGQILRRTRIDEIPQLINVLRGEMSLLGPRPHLPSEVARYDKHHGKLFTIKPGMSGMAQVNGSAGLPFEQEAKLDIGYIENWSLWLDVILLLKTCRILFTDRNAV